MIYYTSWLESLLNEGATGSLEEIRMTATYDNVHIIHKLTTEFYQRVREPYVQRFIPEPVMNPTQAGIILTMLDRSGAEINDRHSVALSALLVQAAMDTHDRIGIMETTSEIERKQRQLTVLAGDYFSSLYYRLLAECGEGKFIKVFSRAIQEINEAKMRVTEADSESEAMEHFMIVRSALTTHLAAFLGFASSIPSIRRLYLLQCLTGREESFMLNTAVNQSASSRKSLAQQAYGLIKEEGQEDFPLYHIIQQEADMLMASMRTGE
jgi:heptaprenyl diphosphate synthase